MPSKNSPLRYVGVSRRTRQPTTAGSRQKCHTHTHQILKLTALEILDISNNRITRLPEDIANLSSLKVLAISRNRIERLPTSLGDISSLRMLKFDKNRLLFPPPEICSLREDTPTPADENEREAMITSQIKKYLRQQSIRHKLQVDSDGEEG